MTNIARASLGEKAVGSVLICRANRPNDAEGSTLLRTIEYPRVNLSAKNQDVPTVPITIVILHMTSKDGGTQSTDGTCSEGWEPGRNLQASARPAAFDASCTMHGACE